MIGRIIELAAKFPLRVLALTVVACAVGLYQLAKIPLDAIPDMSETQVIVSSQWDRDPNQVEAQVTYPIVASLTGGPKVRTVRGVSDFGNSYVHVIFEQGTDIYWARQRVQEALQGLRAQLPTDAVTTLGPDASSLGWVFQYVLRDKTGSHDLSELRSMQDFYIRNHLRAVPGVSDVASVGGFSKEYQVFVDPLKLRDHNIGISNVEDALRSSNTDSGARVLESGEAEYMVRGLGYAQSVDDLKNSVINANNAGTPLRVSDVAQVQAGPAFRRGAADFDGRGEAVSGIVIMRDHGSVPQVVAGVKAKLHEISAGLPPGVEVVPVYDRSELVARSISHLRWTLLEVVITVALIVLVFLRHLPSAVVPIVTLPVALLIALIPFGTMGITANIMSLAGLAMAVGALVDASIVVVEQTHIRLERWQAAGGLGDYLDVVVAGFKEVARPSFFALVIIAVAFLPVIALGGEAGKMFGPLAIAKSCAIMIGAILAITLDPALRVALLRFNDFDTGSPRLKSLFRKTLLVSIVSQSDNVLSQLLTRVYEPCVRWSLRHKLTLFAGIGLSACLAGIVYSHLGSELFPPLEEGAILYMPSAPSGVSITEVTRLLRECDRVIASTPEVDHVLGKAGHANTATDPAPLSMLEVLITLKPQKDWPRKLTWYSSWAPDWLKPVFRPFTSDVRSVDEIIAGLDQKLQIPGVRNAWTTPVRGRIDMLATGIRTPLGLKITGSDPLQIASLADEVARSLQQLPAVRNAYSERIEDGYYVDVKWDRQELARYGISIQQAQDTLSAAVGGQSVTTVIEGRERYPVTVRYMRDYRSDISALKRVLLQAPLAGRQVPLDSVASVTRSAGPSMIRDEDGQLTSYVFADIGSADLQPFIVQADQRIRSDVSFPAGSSFTWSGQYPEMRRANRLIGIVIPVTLLLIVLLLRAATSSWVQTGIVMLAVPLSAIGATLLLGALGYKLSLPVWVGIISLLGVDAETGIFMLMYLDLAFQERVSANRMRHSADLDEAIVEGAAKRVRPKMMTVAAMLAGLLPVVLSHGPGSEIMKRVAVPMIGGITTSFLFELLAYPVIYRTWKARSMKELSFPVILAAREPEGVCLACPEKG